MPNDQDKTEVCIGLDYIYNRLILGALFMRSYDVYFDRTNK